MRLGSSTSPSSRAAIKSPGGRGGRLLGWHRRHRARSATRTPTSRRPPASRRRARAHRPTVTNSRHPPLVGCSARTSADVRRALPGPVLRWRGDRRRACHSVGLTPSTWAKLEEDVANVRSWAPDDMEVQIAASGPRGVEASGPGGHRPDPGDGAGRDGPADAVRPRRGGPHGGPASPLPCASGASSRRTSRRTRPPPDAARISQPWPSGGHRPLLVQLDLRGQGRAEPGSRSCGSGWPATTSPTTGWRREHQRLPVPTDHPDLQEYLSTGSSCSARRTSARRGCARGHRRGPGRLLVHPIAADPGRGPDPSGCGNDRRGRCSRCPTPSRPGLKWTNEERRCDDRSRLPLVRSMACGYWISASTWPGRWQRPCWPRPARR